jgi:hypothetical protein
MDKLQKDTSSSLKDYKQGVNKKPIDIFKPGQIYSTEKLEALFVNARDNAIGKFRDVLKELPNVDPQLEEKIIYDGSNAFGIELKKSVDVIDLAYDFLNYYHVIKTEEQLRYEFERARKVFHDKIELPVIIEFDYQIYNFADIFKTPTFYSYANPSSITEYGKGAYHIAFPSTQALLTDDEVMVAMKHEWGHIYQGHCGHKFKQNEKFEMNNANQAMDISINLGMTPEEKELLFSVVRKITNKPNACPCMDLPSPRGKGGFNIRLNTKPSDWKTPLKYIKAYYKPNEDENPPPPPPQDNKIEVGDYVSIDGTSPKKRGKVIDIDETTGDYTIEEISQEEWERIKEDMKNSSYEM